MQKIITEKSSHLKFISSMDWAIIIVFALIGLGMNFLPFNMGIFLVLQVVLPGTIFIMYKHRPVMMFAVYLFFSILPTGAYGGFTATLQPAVSWQYYYLSATAVVLFLFIFLFWSVFASRKTFKLNKPLVCFVIFMILSLGWTVSMARYNLSTFWKMCALYLILPLFINNENDLKLVFAAYVIYLNAFCISILPILFARTEIYRGIVLLDPNYASLGITIGIAIVLSGLSKFQKILSNKFKLLLYLTIVISLLTMSFFVSITAFIILFLLLTLFFLYNFKNLKVLLLNTIVFSVIYIVFNHYRLFHAIEGRFRTEALMEGSGRSVIQTSLLRSFAEFDIFGILLGKGFLTAAYYSIGGAGAHNSYISILIGFGLIGLLIYFIYLLNIGLRIKNGQYNAFCMLFVALFVWGFSLQPFYINYGILGFCLLTAIANLSFPYSTQTEL